MRSDQIAPIMKQAIVAVEDKRFFEHNGVDMRGIVRAAVGGRPQQGGRRGRLDDHAAVRQERVQPQRQDDRAQGARGRARLAADAALVEGPDPDRVPQHDLLRERRVRDPPGGAHVLPRQERGRADASRGGAAGRHPGEPVAVRPGRSTRSPRSSDAAYVLQQLYDQGRITAAELRRANATPLPKPEDVRLPGHARACAVLRQLRDRPARRALRRREGVRRRPRGDDDDRPRPPGEGARGDRADPPRPERPGGRARRDRPAHRRGEGDVRRHELPPQPVQPRHAGGAPAGLVVQADRARGRAAEGHRAGRRTSRRSRSRSTPATGSGRSRTTRAATSAAST